MGCDGKVIAMPGQRVRGFPCIRTYPAVEKHGFVWVWPGDPAQADPAKIHHLEWAENPEWAYGGGLYHHARGYPPVVGKPMEPTPQENVDASRLRPKRDGEGKAPTKNQEATAMNPP